MGDGTEFDDEEDGWEEPEPTPGPLFYGIVGDAREWPSSVKPDAIWDLVDEVFEPNLLRSYVITLHLYIEYWLDKLLAQAQLSAKGTFSRKVARLHDKGTLTGITYDNILAINRVRNLYAHELDLGKVQLEVETLLAQLKLDKNFKSTDQDRLRTICFQTMFMLDATLANGGTAPGSEPYPHEKVLAKLLADGKLFWQECEKLEHEVRGMEETYVLRCPLCRTGTIEREKDNTPGFKESFLYPCTNCGLRGDGPFLDLGTARPEFRKPPKTDPLEDKGE